jgi:YD repeat-containing protein
VPSHLYEGSQPSRVTNFSYDSRGNLLNKSVVDSSEQTQTWVWTYDSLGQVLTATGPRKDVTATTSYTYLFTGNLHTVSNPLGQVTTFSNYTGSGYPQTIVDPNGLTTTLTYDARNRLLSQSVGSETTSYHYDDAGQLDLVTLPDGNSVSYVYDPGHRLTEIHDLAGDKIIYTLDAAGNTLNQTITDTNGIGSLLKHIEQGLAHARLFAAR